MGTLIHMIWENVLAVLFPERCVGCNIEGTVFCKNCRLETRESGKETFSPPSLDALWHYGNYDHGLLRKALRRFKYHGTEGLAEPFGEMLCELLRESGLTFSAYETLLLPIPLSPERLRERGYNQAELLTKMLSQNLSLPLETGLLQKIRHTPSQTGLSQRERIQNVRNSFALSTPEKIRGKTILLVDDISTTGATLSEAARILKEAGAKRVIGLVVAKG